MALGGPPIYPTYRFAELGCWIRPAVSIQPLTPEQLEQQEREYEERRRKLQEADVKARELLLSRLTPEQKASFEAKLEFGVLGSAGTSYLINCTSTTGNVSVLTGPEEGLSLCAYPVNVPRCDIWLAQKLALESDEDAFLKRAIRYSGWYQPTTFFRGIFVQ